jgi:drug/metabolite transporter (DMT)-like permease
LTAKFDIRPHLALLAANVMYGANYVIAKGLMPGIIGANAFIFYRVLGATAMFWALYAFRFSKINKQDLLRLALCGVFGIAINQLCFFNGLMRTSPVNASVFMTLTPILVPLVSVIRGRGEKIGKRQMIGILVGAAGSVAFTLLGTNSGFATGLGDFLIILNAISYAVYLVLIKPLLERHHPWTVITWVFTFGLIYVLLFPPTWAEMGEVKWNAFDTITTLRFSFVIVCVTFLPYLLYTFAIKYVSPHVTAVYIYLQPILTAGFIYLFAAVSNEDYSGDITWEKVASAMVIFAGVYLVIMPGRNSK